MSSKHKVLKTVLKRNELAVAVEKAISFVKANSQIFWGLSLAVLALALTLLGLKIYHQRQVQNFNQQWHAVSETLLKEQKLKDLIADYPSLPAHALASFELAQYQMENQKSAEALQTLASGLEGSDSNILTTVLVLQSVAMYKSQKQFGEAVQFLDAQKHKVLPSYLPHADLLKADLALLAGDVAKARLLYTQLSSVAQEGGQSADVSQAQVAKLAKEKLLQLELQTK